MKEDDLKGPVIVWEDYGYEGWKPSSFPNIKSALMTTRYNSFIITKKIDFEVKEIE